jgi:cytochrome c biogenesis protein CcmG/thiol:disulfide interchange protein DsbE
MSVAHASKPHPASSSLPPVSARTFAVFLGALLLIGLLGFGLVSKGEGSLAVGEDVPVAELPVLGSDGTGSVADYEGRWVLINVWASWCDPCRDEAPALERFYRAHGGRDFEILGIDTQDDEASAQQFIDEFKLTYPHLHDGSGDYADELETTGVPENFLIDPDGKVAAALHGQVTEGYLRDTVEPLIEGRS